MISEVAVTESAVATSYANLLPTGKDLGTELAWLVEQLLLRARSCNPVKPFNRDDIASINRRNVTSVTITWT